MIYPNKHVRVEDSIIFKMIYILKNLDDSEVRINELYYKLRKYYDNIDEFIYSIDVLYILNVIDVNFDKETIIYVKRN